MDTWNYVPVTCDGFEEEIREEAVEAFVRIARQYDAWCRRVCGDDGEKLAVWLDSLFVSALDCDGESEDGDGNEIVWEWEVTLEDNGTIYATVYLDGDGLEAEKIARLLRGEIRRAGVRIARGPLG